MSSRIRLKFLKGDAGINAQQKGDAGIYARSNRFKFLKGDAGINALLNLSEF